MPLSGSKVLSFVAKKVFKEADVDKSGSMDVKELHVAILMVYDKLNAKLPVRLDPPEHGEIKRILKRFDHNKDGSLDQEEFIECVNNLVGLTTDRGSLFDSIAFKVARKNLMKMLVIPFAAILLKRVINKASKSEAADNIPVGVMHFEIEGLAKMGSAAVLSRSA